MTQSFDFGRLAQLPADLRALFEAQRALLEAERIRADNELAARLHIESELAASRELVERLQLLVKEYERARFASLIATCKLNNVEPYAWMKVTLEAIANGHPQSRIDELMPWAFKPEPPAAD